MGDAHICLLPVQVVELVHGFPLVDWRQHGLKAIFFKYGISFLYISITLQVRFELLIRDFFIDCINPTLARY